MKKKRIDILLVENNLATSIEHAVALLMTGTVLVNQQPVTTPGTMIPLTAKISLKPEMPYVSRGGYKLAAALDAFAVNPANAICADTGASTGGFTDVLLQRGAQKIYAIDVGYGNLAWKLRQDPRVIVMERTNARLLTCLPDKIDLVVVDVSFISLKLILPAAQKWVNSCANFITLVKPQFEAPKEWVQPGGVIKDPTIHILILTAITAWCQQNNLFIAGLIASPLTGPAGNKEFLLHLTTRLPDNPANLPRLIESVCTISTPL